MRETKGASKDWRYHYIKRIGRRKVGKVAQQVEEAKRRRELDGERSTYVNFLALKSVNVMSPEALAADLRAAKYIHDRIVRLHAPDVAAIDSKPLSEESHPPYDLVQELQMEIRSYEGFLREDRLHRWADDDFEDIIDGHRRAIAGYRQALELYSQGPECFMAAYEDTALVFQGKRVDKRVFRKLYGW